MFNEVAAWNRRALPLGNLSLGKLQRYKEAREGLSSVRLPPLCDPNCPTCLLSVQAALDKVVAAADDLLEGL